MLNCTIKVFGLYLVFRKCTWLNRAPGDLSRTEVYMIIGKKQGNTDEEVGQYRIGWARNHFHYSLIDTSKRIGTNSAVSNKAILHVGHEGKLCMCPENGRGDL